MLVYKLQMCRFSVPRIEAEKEFGLKVRSDWYTVEQLISESKHVCRRHPDDEFVPYVDPPPNYKPPDDVPSCVYCPEFLVLKKSSSQKNIVLRWSRKQKPLPISQRVLF
jgi:hypothetical protein